MRKEISYIVPAGVSMTLQQTLRGPMSLTCRQVRSAKFRENGILVNGERSRVSRMLFEGDEVRVLLEDVHDPSQVRGIRFASGFGAPGSCSSGRDVPGSGSSDRDVPGSGSSGSGSSGRPCLPPLPTEQILFEDEDLLVVNKPAGICVHPSHGHYGDTLADQVYYRYALMGITEIPRVVGRLDKDTSGAVLFARNKVAAQRLTDKKAVRKEYLALAQGNINMTTLMENPALALGNQAPALGYPAPVMENSSSTNPMSPKPDSVWLTISCPIAKDPSSLSRMLPDPDGRYAGKTAVTHLQVVASVPEIEATLLRLRLDTGRTHQIRVHMAYIGHPLLGDPLYGTGPSGGFTRAALHCSRMELLHPFTREKISICAPLPEDFPAHAEAR